MSRFSGDPEDLHLKDLLLTKDPFFHTLPYPQLKIALTRFEKVQDVDLPALKAIIARIQTDPGLTEKYHQQVGQLLVSTVEQLQKTGMFESRPSKPLDYRLQLAAAAGRNIAKLAETASSAKAGYEELAQLWLLALASNKQNEMAAYTAMWGALSLPASRKRDLVTSLAIQHPSLSVRRLASHGVATIQEHELKAAVLARMSVDYDALIRLRSDILKHPRSPINWLLGLVFLRKPSY